MNKFFRKQICLLLSIIFILMASSTSVSALNCDSLAPVVSGATASKYLRANPTVYEMGDGYAVIWSTSFSGIGYITYTYNGVKYTVYDERNGIARTDDNVHVVKVPHAHLSNNSYTVYTKEVVSQNDGGVSYGVTISAGPIRLKGYNGGKDVKFLVLTDVHGNLNNAKQAASRFTEDPDMIIFNGDIADHIQSKDQMIDDVFKISGAVSGGKYPVIYCRGNHETRGRYAAMLLDYFPTETGEFYFDFEYGPLHGIVIDTGEDKVDSHVEYGGLVNYKEYHMKQEVWLRTLRKSSTAKYTFGIYHIPHINSLQNGIDLSDSISHLGIQFAVSGHNHVCMNLPVGTYNNINHSTYICGGPLSNVGYVGTFVKFTGNEVKVKSCSASGSVVNDISSPLSQYVGAIPPQITAENGLNAQTSVSTTSGINIIAQPAVFETGGDWYNVVWATDISSVGYVQYTYKGKVYQVFDEAGGYRRSYDNIHTVKVPKEHLANNKYFVASFNMKVHEPYSFSRGASIVSPTYLFEDRRNDKTLNIVACPDIKATSYYCDRIIKAKNSVNALGTSPALIVLGGDIANSLGTKDGFISLISAAGTISEGKHPVVLSRGNTECRGAFATNIIRYLPTATGEFYFTFPMGDYTFVNVDTAEDKEDSHIEYSGHVFFDELRKKQDSYLKSVDGGKLVVLNHIGLGNYFGYDWQNLLRNKGAILNISGHNRTFGINNAPIYNVIAGGYNASSSKTISTSFILSDNFAHITGSSDAGEAVYSNTVNLNDGKNISVTPKEPPKVDGKYIVSEASHLWWISNQTTSSNSFIGETFVFASDIDLNLVPFTPIGGNDINSLDDNLVSKGFSGTIDGNGYSIKNLNIISNSNNVGFVGVLRGGTVKNLTIESGVVKGSSYVGGIVGYNRSGNIECCYNGAVIYSKNGGKIGGIAGFNSFGGKINCCGNYGSILAYSKDSLLGGITGQSYTLMDNVISNSFNRGSVSGQSSSSHAGGIVGYAGVTKCEIINCYNSASVNSLGLCGGLIPNYKADGQISFTNSYIESGNNGSTTAFSTTNSWQSTVGSGAISVCEKSSMKTDAFASQLGADVFAIIDGMNDNYPIHISVLAQLEKIVLRDHSGLELKGGIISGESEKTDNDSFRKKILNTDGISFSSVATGVNVELRRNGVLLDSATIVILGDVDGDGEVTVTDYLIIKTVFLDNLALEGAYLMAADVEPNGTIDSTDYLRIKSYFLGDYNLYN